MERIDATAFCLQCNLKIYGPLDIEEKVYAGEVLKYVVREKDEEEEPETLFNKAVAHHLTENKNVQNELLKLTENNSDELVDFTDDSIQHRRYHLDGIGYIAISSAISKTLIFNEPPWGVK